MRRVRARGAGRGSAAPQPYSDKCPGTPARHCLSVSYSGAVAQPHNKRRTPCSWGAGEHGGPADTVLDSGSHKQARKGQHFGVLATGQAAF